MDSIIKNGLQNSMSYQEYRNLVIEMAEKKSTTGDSKTEELVNYTILNNSRMRRWDKTIKVPQNIGKKVKSFKEKVTWLVIAESWCGDAAHVLPVLNKLAELNNHIDLRVVLRDENPELMDAFLTAGARSIPKMIVIEKISGGVLETYGPRPSEATAYVNRFKAKYGTITSEFKEDLQHWYNTNKGLNVMEDIVEMLCRLEPNLCQ
ncbi:thioredoxin family protein [Confluentibacter sediminis]|uniref:thioredoxin family protein n=1 Tax=Confluentibacter sediminis TaxID=2219045 RepID=UPI000DAEE127|nr:thioredoxin family protein [Confluentibacter sediminis]